MQSLSIKCSDGSTLPIGRQYLDWLKNVPNAETGDFQTYAPVDEAEQLPTFEFEESCAGGYDEARARPNTNTKPDRPFLAPIEAFFRCVCNAG